MKSFFAEFYNFPKFSKNFETILVNMRCQFCLGAELIQQDGTILPDDLPIKLQENRAGRVAINYNCYCIARLKLTI